MVSPIKVTSQKLKDEAQNIENIVKAMETEMTSMQNTAKNLLSSWEGEAKQAFVDSVNKNTTLLKNFTNNARKYKDVLNAGAQEYEAGEREAKRIASTKG